MFTHIPEPGDQCRPSYVSRFAADDGEKPAATGSRCVETQSRRRRLPCHSAKRFENCISERCVGLDAYSCRRHLEGRILSTILIATGVVAFGTVAFLILRRPKARSRAATRPNRQPNPAASTRPASTPTASRSPFRAVSIRVGGNPCETAKVLSRKRFRGNEAPGLPLDACDRDRCECRYEHHADRRTGQDRRSPFQSVGEFFGEEVGNERRSETGDRRRS